MVTAITKDTYRTEIVSENHLVISDEPASRGGLDEGLTPKQLLSASLASCTTVTLRMYADMKKWEVEAFKVSVEQMMDVKTNEMYLRKKITVVGDVDEKQLERFHVIAGKCPVHKLLLKSITITSSIQKH